MVEVEAKSNIVILDWTYLAEPPASLGLDSTPYWHLGSYEVVLVSRTIDSYSIRNW